MTAFDYIVLAVLGISILISVMRGLVREVLALISWATAFWLASNFGAKFAPFLPASIPGPSLRLLAAFVVLFLGTLLVMTLLSITLSEFMRTAGLTGFDRGMGAVFGFVRGLLAVLVLMVMAGLTSLPKQDFWKNAMFSSPLEAGVTAVKPWLPVTVAQRIRYD